MPTENKNHPDDHAAIERLHQQYVGKIESFSDDLMAFQDAAYAMGLDRGKLLEAKRAEALQQRLTAADERVDLLEGLLRQFQEVAHGGFLDDDHVRRIRRDVDAALKPAEVCVDHLDDHDRSSRAYWADQAKQGKPYEQQLREACERNNIDHGLDNE